MPSYSTDRRGALKILGAIGATCAYPFAGDELFGQTAEHHHMAPAVEAPLPSRPAFFGEADFETISRLSDLILPATDTPGALAAGVPLYIDMLVGRNAAQQLLMADGLRWLDEEALRIGQTRFVGLSEEQQLTILLPLCEAADKGAARARNVEFFRAVKGMTADGYYTSRTGLIEELGYDGNTAMSSYPECVPEH